MTYSCAIFPSLDADLKRPTDPDALHTAQLRKLQHIIRKADIRPGHRVRPPPLCLPLSLTPAQVLEIGTGWGSLALAIARGVPHTSVDTLTLSPAQAAHARALIEGDAVRVHVCDFRAMPAAWRGVFDRVVSVEMVEAVGADMYEVRAGLLRGCVWMRECFWAGVLRGDRLGAEAPHGRGRRAGDHDPRGAVRRVREVRGLHQQMGAPSRPVRASMH